MQATAMAPIAEQAMPDADFGGVGVAQGPA